MKTKLKIKVGMTLKIKVGMTHDYAAQRGILGVHL